MGSYLLPLLLFLTLYTYPEAKTLNKITRVAVIDTGLDLNDPRFAGVLCKSGHKDFTNTSLIDVIGHGTHVAGIIKNYTVNTSYCLIILKYYDAKRPETSTENLLNAFKEAVKLKVDIVNMSGGGYYNSKAEYNLLKANPEILIIGAAGNDNQDKRFYPCAYPLPHTLCVGSTDQNGAKLESSNYGDWVKAWQIGLNVLSFLPNNETGYMTGTSQATAIQTAVELNKRY